MAAEWLAEHGYASTVDYLVAMCPAGARRDRPAPPRQRRRPLRRRAGRACGPVSPSPGDDDRVAQRRPRLPTAARPTRRPSAAWPPSRPPASWPSRSPPGSSSASARTGPTASTPSRPSPTSHRRHGHVQEVIVQNFLPKAGHRRCTRAPPCPPDDYLEAIALARLILPAESTCRPRRTCPTTSASCSTPASTTGAASPPSPPTTSTPSGPGPTSTASARSPRPPASRWPPGSPIYPEFALDPERWLDAGLRFPVHGPLRRRGPRPRRPRRGVPADGRRGPQRRRRRRGRPGRPPLDASGTSAPTSTRPCSCPAPARATGAVAEVLDGVRARPGGRRGRDRHPVLGPGPRGRRRRRGGRRAAPRRSSATPSPASATATSTTRTSAPSSAGSAASRRARCRSTCGARPTCSRSTTSPSRVARGRPSWAPPRCACRAASTPTSTATTTSTSPGP